MELASFKPLKVADINLLSTEIRDLGKLALQLGGVTETVTVTSEVTPVQVADSSRRTTLTLDDIATIQIKGRDIFGMLGILPGVQDTNLNRDFAQWRSAISITINGMPSQNKDVRVDGMNIVDEGGCGTAYVNLNMDAIGEVQVIANGYTAENGRNNGGVISMVTKSGTNQLRASGWYNGRRDKFNENDYFRKADRPGEAALPRQYLRLQRRRPGRDPRPRSTAGSGRQKKFYFFGSQEFTDDARPTTTTRANMPTALESAATSRQTRITNGTIQPIIDPLTGSSSRATRFRRGDTRMRRAVQLHRPARSAHAADPAAEAERHPEPAGRSGVDLELGLRPDAGARPDEQRPADRSRIHRQDPHGVRAVKDRDDDWSWNRLTPGTGYVNQNTPGLLIVDDRHAGAEADRRQRDRASATRTTAGASRRPDDFDYTSLYRSTLGVDPPRFEAVRGLQRSAATRGLRRTQVDEWPYAPRFSTTGGNRSNWRTIASATATSMPTDPRLNLSGRLYFRTTCR